MSVADKKIIMSANNLTIAENEQKVFNAGQKSMVDESKIIEATVSGVGNVTIDDVSEVPHKLKITITAASTSREQIPITKYLSCRFGQTVPEPINGITYSVDTNGVISATGTPTDMSTMPFHISGSPQMYGKENAIQLEPGVTYYFKGVDTAGGISSQNIHIGVWAGDTIAEYMDIGDGVTFTVPSDYPSYYLICYIQISKQLGPVENLTFTPRLYKISEGGYSPAPGVSVTVSSDSSEPITYTTNEDGVIEGVASLSPSMTFQSTVENAVISVDYHKSWGMYTMWSSVWDGIQERGTKIYYGNVFSGSGWTDKNFKPKYDIRPKGAGAADGGSSMFYGCSITDLAAALERQGVVLDISQEAVLGNAFMYTDITHIPALVFQKNCKSSGIFNRSENLHTIDKLTVGTNNTFDTWFYRCYALRNITFDGDIAASINFSSCPLSVESMKSVISCLVNYAGVEGKEGTCTVTFSSTCWDVLESGNDAPGGYDTWRNYVASLGWLT